MVRYINPSYLQPESGDTYMSFCPLGERIAARLICALMVFGAVTAIYTLISVYFGA